MEPKALEDAVAPELERMGIECVKLEIVGSKTSPIVRLFIDKPDGVSIKNCSMVSRMLGMILEEMDPFPGRYLVEVSSPGNNRPLVKEEHFNRFKGSNARVRFQDEEGSKKTYTGIILSCINGVLRIDTKTGGENINIDAILNANLVGVEYQIDKKIKHSKRSKGGK